MMSSAERSSGRLPPCAALAPSPLQAPQQRGRAGGGIDDNQRREFLREGDRTPLRDRAAHRMPNQHDLGAEVIDQRPNIVNV